MSTVDWAQVSLTVALVVVTGLYVWQTRGIVKNMEKDREAMHRPILIFQMMYWWSSLILTLRIENVGGGAAVNVEGNVESRLKTSLQEAKQRFLFLVI